MGRVVLQCEIRQLIMYTIERLKSMETQENRFRFAERNAVLNIYSLHRQFSTRKCAACLETLAAPLKARCIVCVTSKKFQHKGEPISHLFTRLT